MSMTFNELKEYLSNQVDEVALLELLNLTSETLVNTFSDMIEALWLDGRFDELMNEEDAIDDGRSEPD